MKGRLVYPSAYTTAAEAARKAKGMDLADAVEHLAWLIAMQSQAAAGREARSAITLAGFLEPFYARIEALSGKMVKRPAAWAPDPYEGRNPKDVEDEREDAKARASTDEPATVPDIPQAEAEAVSLAETMGINLAEVKAGGAKITAGDVRRHAKRLEKMSA